MDTCTMYMQTCCGYMCFTCMEIRGSLASGVLWWSVFIVVFDKLPSIRPVYTQIVYRARGMHCCAV